MPSARMCPQGKVAMMIPYHNLHVYEVSGEVLNSRDFFKKDFIGCWNEEGASFLFFSEPHDEEVERLIRQKGLSLLAQDVLDYKAWQAGEELEPFRLANLVICPPWEHTGVEEGEVLIQLDPCVVFGTGSHPTTRSCLAALWEIYRKERPKRVLDLGTGSGILALAAAKWGAEKVLAVDCNELAVDTARRNVSLNGESQRIVVKRGKAEDWIEEEADLVSANLYFEIIIALLHREAFFRKRWIVVSGIFEKDSGEIERRWNRRSVQTYRRIQEKKWVTLVGLNES
jgi:ribosomal protein L11 methyltransferase